MLPLQTVRACVSVAKYALLLEQEGREAAVPVLNGIATPDMENGPEETYPFGQVSTPPVAVQPESENPPEPLLVCTAPLDPAEEPPPPLSAEHVTVPSVLIFRIWPVPVQSLL